jgi:hypothetical protein
MALDPATRIADLETQLAKARAEAESERERFELRLEQARNTLPEQRDPRVVARNIAAMQEVDALRGALRERDRIVNEMTGQLRNLEDQLEDHYRHTDELQRELGKRNQELEEARRQTQLAVRRAEAAKEAAKLQPPWPPTPPPDLTASSPKPDATRRTGSGVGVFALGMLLGALTAISLGAAFWWSGDLPTSPSVAQTGTAAAAGTRVWSPPVDD